MRAILKFTIFTIFCGLFLMQTVVSAQNTSADKTDKSPAASNSQNTSVFKFPDVEGWKKSEVPSNPDLGLGEIAHYDSKEGGRISLYFYEDGLKDFSDDLRDDVLKEELEAAKGAILQLGNMGIYQNIKELKSDTVTIGGSSGKVKAFRSLLTYNSGGTELISEIYLFAYKNNFVKIRASRPKANEKNKAVETFMLKLDAHFSK